MIARHGEGGGMRWIQVGWLELEGGRVIEVQGSSGVGFSSSQSLLHALDEAIDDLDPDCSSPPHPSHRPSKENKWE